VAEAEPVRDLGRGRRTAPVRGGRGENDQVGGVVLGREQRGTARRDGQIGGRRARIREAPRGDPGARSDPLVLGVETFGEVVIGHRLGRQAAA
jgi:hypothetical protein